MATAKDYPVTQGYGYDPNYPLNAGTHKGIDYGCPSGTPIVVNGVQIGLSGATGYATGPHLHVGRWVNGQPTNPGVGNGFTFNNAVVTEVGQDAVNGKFVRVQGDGASWVYLHMSQQTASVNQVLKQQSQGEAPMNDGDVTNLYRSLLGRDPDPGGLNTFRGKSWKEGFYGIIGSSEYATRQAQRAQQITDLQTALANEQNKPPKEVIKEVEKIVEVIKEVPAPVDEKQVVQNVFIRFWNSLFKKG